MVDEVDHETLDVRAIVVLIRDNKVTVSERCKQNVEPRKRERAASPDPS